VRRDAWCSRTRRGTRPGRLWGFSEAHCAFLQACGVHGRAGELGSFSLRAKSDHMRNNIARLGIETLEQRDNPSGWSFWSDDPNWSFWNDNYVGAFLSGGAQGVVNIINGVQDAVIAIPNLVPTIYNVTAGNLGAPRMGYIPSPDWSRDLMSVSRRTVSASSSAVKVPSCF